MVFFGIFLLVVGLIALVISFYAYVEGYCGLSIEEDTAISVMSGLIGAFTLVLSLFILFGEIDQNDNHMGDGGHMQEQVNVVVEDEFPKYYFVRDGEVGFLQNEFGCYDYDGVKLCETAREKFVVSEYGQVIYNN